MAPPADPVLRLLARFAEEGVEYVLVGGQAVRINGFVRATEDVDVLVRATRENGERLRRALNEFEAASELDPAWFEPPADGVPENVRVADTLLVDLLLSANGETYETVQPYIREIVLGGVLVRVLNIDGLLRTKTEWREKDVLDRRMLERLRQGLSDED